MLRRSPFGLLLLAATLGWLSPPHAAAAGTASWPLFRIERSKNANVVQYDARVNEDGSLDREQPVDAYWLKLASDGRRKELNWLQRQAAYGFDVHWQDTGLELEMVAPIGRRVQVVAGSDGWEARTRIDGRTCRVDRIFVKSIERRVLPPTVEYIDFGGRDVDSDEPCNERFVPE
jgi:hypothetical protein